jgi:ribosome maturation factor RimP
MKAKISEILAEMLAGGEVEVVDVVYVVGGRRPLVRVFVDKQSGITVSECGKIARELAVLCHVDESIPEDLRIEVSSPGIERPLKSSADFRRKIGRFVTVTVMENEREKSIEGNIEFVDEDGFVLATKAGNVRYKVCDILRAKQIIKF